MSAMSTGTKIVECVPNFSEGRRKEVIDSIADAISSTEGCSLLDVAPGESTNRTVYTFVGSPSAVLEGALNSARVAFKLIDMKKQKGDFKSSAYSLARYGQSRCVLVRSFSFL